MNHGKRRSIIRAQLTEFVLPPIDDGLVLGKSSPIGHVAVGKALSLLSTTSFDHIPIEDDIIGDILVRTAIMRKISKDQLIAFVLNEIKPLMGEEEIIHLDLEVELTLESKQS
jgi:hypothetical protein